MNIKRPYKLVLVLLLLPLLHAETAQERGKRVVMAALDALGGDRFLAMNDRVESGRAYSFYREKLSGLSRATIYTRYLPPAKPGTLAVRERQMFGKHEDFGVLITEDAEGWDVTFRGARPLPKAQMERYHDTTLHNILYILRQRLKEPGMIFESLGSDVIDNMPVEIVDISDANNEVTTVYFHQSTKLPVRQKFLRRDLVTRERHEEVTIFSKYRDAGGVQWPFAIQRLRDGDKLFEMYSDTVEIDKKLPDAEFQLPSDVRRLKPV
jgi:hypothetical protein